MIHDMLTGSPPFTGSNRKMIADKVMKGKFTMKVYLTPNAKDILRKLLKKNPDQRLGSGTMDGEAVRQNRWDGQTK